MTHGSRLVLGIHGLANKPPREEKQKWWRAAIEEGLRRNCRFESPDLPFDFVYWADLRYDAPLAEASNLEPYSVDTGTGPFPSHDPGASEAEKVRFADRFYRALGWAQEKIGTTPVDDAFIEYRLDDLYGYLEDEDFRARARARLREALDAHRDRRILLAAHSMGSLIAYDVLRAMDREGAPPHLDHLVTLGAPMGLAEVKLKMEQEHGDLAVPASVSRWSNLMDRADVATFGSDIGDAYAPNARGVRVVDVAVLNSYRRPRGDVNHHKSYGYLRTPEFSRAVHAMLSPRAAVSAASGQGQT